MFIIPDEYMDAKTCTNCYKYLTMGPVKKYSSLEIKCGRCTKPDDDGLVQDLVFPKNGLFKCVNKFDGCRRLLTCDRVANHEKSCRSTMIKCPCCKESTILPSYALLKHFQACHEPSILKTALIKMKVTTPRYRTFLYRLKDNLFFIRCRIQTSRSIELKTVFLGQGAVIPKYKYTIHFGDVPCKIETAPMPCLSHDSVSFKGIICRPPVNDVQCVYVQVHLDLEEYEIQLAKNVLISPKCKVSLPRTIDFSSANCSRFSIGPSMTSLVLDSTDHADHSDSPSASPAMTMPTYSEVFMHCITCWKPTSLDPAFLVEIRPQMYQVVCEACANYYLLNPPGQAISLASDLVPELKSVNIAHSCVWQVWGCSRYLLRKELDEHETNCPLQPPRPCPVAGCPFHGKLPDLQKHFEQSHPTRTISLCNALLLLDHCPSSTKNYLYIWAYYDFVLVEVAPYRDNKYQIKLTARRQLETFCQPRPQLMINAADAKLSTVLSEETPFPISNGRLVYVSVFFPDDDD